MGHVQLRELWQVAETCGQLARKPVPVESHHRQLRQGGVGCGDGTFQDVAVEQELRQAGELAEAVRESAAELAGFEGSDQWVGNKG